MPLPALKRVEDFPGADYAEKWRAFLEDIYAVFCDTVVDAKLTFQGCPVRCRWHEPFDGKHASFWHAISEGRVETDRTPDLERCARMAWIQWVICHADDPAHVLWWENERSSKHGRSTHVPLWLFNENYAVILQKRRNQETDETFYLLVTTYCLKPNRAQSFQKEWEAWGASHP